MDAYTPQSITDAVLRQMAGTPNPRLRTVMESAVRHLHEFAREVNLTPAEWLQALDFLTRVGQTCTPVRQEFILLSDVLGLSTLVNLLHDAKAGEASTRTSLLGPFYREGAPEHALGATISKHAADVPEILLWGRVSDATGRALPGARIEVWQTSSAGQYDLQEGDGSTMNYRGTLSSDAQGNYHFRTVRPLGYSIPMDGPVGELVRAQAREGCRPAHIHFLISAPGHRELVTALYFRDRYLESDAVFGASADLVATEAAHDSAAPVPGLPSVHFSFSLARRGALEAGSGRVGADPSKVGAGAR